jgi:hypothetical protein
LYIRQDGGGGTIIVRILSKSALQSAIKVGQVVENTITNAKTFQTATNLTYDIINASWKYSLKLGVLEGIFKGNIDAPPEPLYFLNDNPFFQLGSDTANFATSKLRELYFTIINNNANEKSNK